jgi:hypothetical protein
MRVWIGLEWIGLGFIGLKLNQSLVFAQRVQSLVFEKAINIIAQRDLYNFEGSKRYDLAV